MARGPSCGAGSRRPAACRPSVDLDLLYGRFLERYTARPADKSTVHPDVIEVLHGLRKRGLRLGVCTNKAQAPTDRLLAALGLDRFFEAIVGGDAVPAKKPDAGHLRAVLERLGASPARSVMVGDSAYDLQAARTLGVPCVLVSFGYTPVPARALGAERVIDRFADLPAALASLVELAGQRRTRAPARVPLTPAKRVPNSATGQTGG